MCSSDLPPRAALGPAGHRGAGQVRADGEAVEAPSDEHTNDGVPGLVHNRGQGTGPAPGRGQEEDRCDDHERGPQGAVGRGLGQARKDVVGGDHGGQCASR